VNGRQAKQVAGYVVMPGIMPRIGDLFTSGFGYIAFLIAQIYAMVRILPPNHSYLNPQNIGKFGIRQVIAQAANHLVIKKENIDQMVIFSITLIGLILIVVQIATIIFMLIFEPALASYPTAAHPVGTVVGKSIFFTVDPTFDIAFMLLDQVFGIPAMFGSCIEQGISCKTATASVAPAAIATFPWPFHDALHELFRFYNTGILLVGALIFLYFILIVIGETAVTGTPFGQRFQNVWVPIRLVVAIGLLIPLNYGMNSGQYITLFAAKMGSGFATNAWVTYNNQIRLGAPFPGGAGANPTGERESLIGKPEAPDISPILEALSLVHACASSYWYMDNTNGTKPYVPVYDGVKPYLYKDAPDWMPDTDNVLPVASGTTYEQALQFYNNGDITIRFGENGDDDSNNKIEGDEEEKPKCGEIKITIETVTGNTPLVGPEAVQKMYYELIRDMWWGADTYELNAYAFRYASLKFGNIIDSGHTHACNAPAGPPAPNVSGTGILAGSATECADKPTKEWQEAGVATLLANVKTELDTIWLDYANATHLYEMNSEILSRGWAGAGIWYNTISRTNGNYLSAIRNMPAMTALPTVMQKVESASQKADVKVTRNDRFDPIKREGITSDDAKVAAVLSEVFKYWNDDSKSMFSEEVRISGSPFEDTMNLIFGTQPLSAMNGENVSTHPLTQLAMLGKGLVDASIRNVATASAGSAIGGVAAILDKAIPGFEAPVSEFILSTAFVGLTAGLVLYYIVPFLPFIYFFFAVASWVKSIFEAMVGVPLWALAHLRIDGDGLPGTSALNGYFLIFEIFLRPILTIFGLVAATLIFTAQVRVLHFLWDLVTQNLSGFDNDATISLTGANGRLAFKRSIVDQFFFNIIYAIIVYMMAVAAFKLIDKIPDNLLRWMGNQVSSFSDINQDSVDGLTRTAALGGATSGQRLAQGLHKGVQGTAQQAGSLGALLTGAK